MDAEGLRAQLTSLKALRDSDADGRQAVISALKLFATLSSYEERRAFLDAVEKMLTDESSNIRSFAVEICVGFYDFSDQLKETM